MNRHKNVLSNFSQNLRQNTESQEQGRKNMQSPTTLGKCPRHHSVCHLHIWHTTRSQTYDMFADETKTYAQIKDEKDHAKQKYITNQHQ